MVLVSRFDYKKAEASTEQRSSCGTGSTSSVWCQASPSPASLVTGAPTCAVQDGCTDAENSHVRCPDAPQRACGFTRRGPLYTFCFTASADCTKTDHECL